MKPSLHLSQYPCPPIGCCLFFALSLDYLLLNATYHSLQEPTARRGVPPQDQRSQSSQATRDGIHNGHLPWIRPDISWTPHSPDPGQKAMLIMVCVYGQASHLNDLGRPLVSFSSLYSRDLKRFQTQGCKAVEGTGRSQCVTSAFLLLAFLSP